MFEYLKYSCVTGKTLFQNNQSAVWPNNVAMISPAQAAQGSGV